MKSIPSCHHAAASEKENEVGKSKKRSSAAIISHRSGAVVTPPRPSSSASGGGDNTQVEGEPPVASIDIIDIKTGGWTEAEHNLFLYGLELHRKGSSDPLLDLINIDDCDVVTKLVDILFCWEAQDNDDSEEQVVGDDDEFSLFDSSIEHDTVIQAGGIVEATIPYAASSSEGDEMEIDNDQKEENW